MSEKIKLEVISFAQTFVTLFLSTISLTISQLPVESLADYHTYTTSFVVGIVVAAARTALKAAWQRLLPESVGGIPTKG